MHAMVRVQLADLNDPAQQASIIELLDMYCRDPFGQGQPLSPEARRNLIPGLKGHGGAKVFLAHDRQATVGLAVCFVGFSTFRGRPLLNIHDIAVEPKWRGLGVGRALLTAIEAEARQLACCKITMEVRSNNDRAKRLYAQEGYQGSDPENWFWTKEL
jgi:ribosomal protein S18 acetylase RimI-like enzyme